VTRKGASGFEIMHHLDVKSSKRRAWHCLVIIL
jgi:hypothetical protein